MSRQTAAALLLVLCVELLAGAGTLGFRIGRALAGGQANIARPGETATYQSGGRTISVEVFRPAGEGKRPAILLLHGADCLQVPLITAGYRQSARRLAQRGYLVLLPHYMDRTGNRSTNPLDMARNFQTWMETIRDGITCAQGRSDVDREQIGVVGVSLGASLALCVSGVDERVKAVVEYFGGLPAAAVPLLKRMPPVLILHGDADLLVNVQEAYKLERALKDKKLLYEMHIYPGQGHGFRGAAAADADERTVTFLNRHLKPGQPGPHPPGKTPSGDASRSSPPPVTTQPAPARPNPMLHQQGLRIVDRQGREVKLRGVSLGGWLVWEGWIFGKGILTSQATMTTRLEKALGSPETDRFRRAVYENFITEADLRRIAQAGFNCVRVPLHYRLFDTPDGWRLLDRLLDWCRKYRLYAILDLHMVPGSALGMVEPKPVWTTEETRQKVIGLWKALAARYRARETVAGYDLIGEPLPPSGEALVRLYRQIIAAIREADPDHLVFLEGRRFATDFSMFDRPPDANMAYSFHMYTWFGDDRAQKLGEYLALARRQNVPLWVGEFGENSYEMIRSTAAMYAQSPEINGWAFWTWKKAPTAYPGLVTIRVPQDWAKVMDWLASLLGLNPPDPAAIRAGMNAFLEAIRLDRCDYDPRMEQALLPRP